MTELRNHIDEVDEQIVRLLAKRFVLTRKVGRFKKRMDLKPVDLERERVQAQRLAKLSKMNRLNAALTLSIYRLIIEEVVTSHKMLRKKSNNKFHKS